MDSDDVHTVVLGLGTNIEPRVQYMNECYKRLCTLSETTVIRTSRLYESSPMYIENQARFLNSVILLKTSLSPLHLLEAVKAIEVALGRVPSSSPLYVRFGPRVMDIDILLYDNMEINNSPLLIIPHPRMHERPFVLVPLQDVQDLLENFQCFHSAAIDTALYPVLPLGPQRVLRLPKPTTLRRPLIMGVVNFDCESLSNQALSVAEVEAAVDRLVSEGADLIDFGVQSSRPDKVIDNFSKSASIPLLLHSIQYAKSRYPQIPISVDSCDLVIVRRALEAGAEIVNDITGSLKNSEICSLVANSHGAYIAMHCSDGEDVHKTLEVGRSPVTDVVIEDLYVRMQQIRSRLPDWSVMLDPGFGFGKNRTQNFALVRDFYKFSKMGYSILAGISRKRCTRAEYSSDSLEALAGTSVLQGKLIDVGVDILRVHDVAAVKVVFEILNDLGCS